MGFIRSFVFSVVEWGGFASGLGPDVEGSKPLYLKLEHTEKISMA